MVSYVIIIMCSILGLGRLDGESVGYNIKVDKPNINGSFCPGEVVFICSGREVAIAFDWFINGSRVASYTYETFHTFPQNVESSVNVTITSASGGSLIDIVSTLVGNFSYLNGAVIQCGRDPARSDGIFVEPHVAELGNVVFSSARATYGRNSELSLITLVWELMGPIQCPELEVTYGIIVRDNSSNEVFSMNFNCEVGIDQIQCVENVTINISASTFYVVEITQGNRLLNRTEDIAGFIENQIQTMVTASRCLESITCFSSIAGICEVHIGRNMTDALSRDTVMGLTNTTINTTTLSLDWLRDTYYVTQFRNIELIVEGNGTFTAVEGDEKLLDWNIRLIVVGVLFLAMWTFLLIVVVVLVFIYSSKIKKKIVCATFPAINFKRVSITVLAISFFIFVVNVILWIALAAVVATQEDTCDSGWQSLRDDLVVAALIIAIVSCVWPVIILLVCIFMILSKKSISGNKPAKGNEMTVAVHGVHAEKNMTEESIKEAESTISTAGHKKFGENTKDGTNRMKEEIHTAVVSISTGKDIPSSNYDHASQIGGKFKADDPQNQKNMCGHNEYSSLDRVKNNAVAPQNDRHYSPLLHKTGKGGQSVSPHNQAGGVSYEKLDSSHMEPNSSQDTQPRKVKKHGGKNAHITSGQSARPEFTS